MECAGRAKRRRRFGCERHSRFKPKRGRAALAPALHNASPVWWPTSFELQRRLAGAPTFITIVPTVAADANGTATYQDTITAGSYEYQVVPKKASVAGDASNTVAVMAA